MVRAWYMDSVPGDQRLKHRLEGREDVELSLLATLGVKYQKLDADNYETDEKLSTIRSERGYSYSDIITVSPQTLAGYEEKIKMFFEEHIHTDEEIRFILDGSGYFDVRDTNDRWIRIEVVKGDMIVIPAGIYHRFTLDTKDYIKAMRLFIGEPVWTPHNRPADSNPARLQYLAQYGAAVKAC